MWNRNAGPGSDPSPADRSPADRSPAEHESAPAVDRNVALRDLPIAVLELGADGALGWWNVRMSGLLGWPTWTPASFVPTPSEELDAAIRQADGRGTASDDVIIERQGGPAVTVVVSTSAVHDATGTRTGTLVSLEDVTERRQLEQHLRQSERLEAMGKLAGGVAHDFNNLLTVVIGYSQLLLREVPDDHEWREPVEAIAKAARRATELTSQLSTVGRRRVLQPVVVDVRDCLDALEPALHGGVGNQIDLRVVSSDDPTRVRLDPQELELVVTNLVINAAEAMPDGGRLVINSRPLLVMGEAATPIGLAAGSYVVVTVADTGVGMSDDVREHCFDPFFTTKSRRQGAGIGLAAVYGVATQAGGCVGVTSQEGRGCTVRVYLPAVTDEVVEKHVSLDGPQRRRHRLRLLVVDDEAPVLQLLRAVLETNGHEVTTAASAEEALELVARTEQGFHALVSDVVMPGLHGDELARRMMVGDDRLRVLLMSGYIERSATLDPERVSFLSKPFALGELVERVETMAPSRCDAIDIR